MGGPINGKLKTKCVCPFLHSNLSCCWGTMTHVLICHCLLPLKILICLWFVGFLFENLCFFYLLDICCVVIYVIFVSLICRWLFTQTGYRYWCQEMISLRSSLIQRPCLVLLKTSHSLRIKIAHQETPPTQTPFKNVEDCSFILSPSPFTIGLFDIRATNHIQLSWVWHRMFLFSCIVLFFLSRWFRYIDWVRGDYLSAFCVNSIRIKNWFMPFSL